MTTQTQEQPSLAEIYAGEALGTPWPAGASPHLIGRNLIVACNARRGWYKRPDVGYESLPQAPSHRGDGLAIGWRRLPPENERNYPGAHPGAHAFDRSGDYAAAARDAMLPWGPPVYDPSAAIDKQPNKSLPAGLWHVHLEYAGSPWDGYDLPAVCDEGDVWLWTPSLRAAIACGYGVAAFEAILWPDQHPLLRTWAERVWAARRALEENDGSDELDRWPIPQARHEAVKLVKATYVQTIGKFGDLETGARLEREDYDRRAPAWYRPEWFATIHAEALAYSFAVMRRAVARGYPPLWARIDTQGYIGRKDDLYTFNWETAESAGLFTKPGALGAWRYDYSLPMGPLLDPNPQSVRVEGRAAKANLPGAKVRE